jgi:hypothetical protein
MTKAFEVKLTSDPGEVIAKARVAARDNGVNFEGDDQTGHFSGHGIEGSYLILENTLAIHITKKPFIMPWGMIEKTLRNYFA